MTTNASLQAKPFTVFSYPKPLYGHNYCYTAGGRIKNTVLERSLATETESLTLKLKPTLKPLSTSTSTLTQHLPFSPMTIPSFGQ